MAGISSIGIGSGVLTSDLIDKLVAVEKEPADKRLTSRENTLNTQLSEFGRVQSALVDLRLASRSLDSMADVLAVKASTTSSAFSATASSDAPLGQFSIEVTQLAQAHSLASSVFTNKTDTIGTGTLSITVGTTTKNITINSSNNTLEGIRDAVNAETGLDVSASVLDTGSGFQLVFNATQTGLANDITINVTDDDSNNTDTNGLSQLVFNGTTNNLTETVQAKDANLKVNGISITRSSNTVSDAIEGVTLNLTGTNTGAASSLSITRDEATIVDRVQEFVDKFNAYQTLVNELTAFNPDTLEAGVLIGDSTLRSITAQTRDILSGVVKGLETANIRSLADIGISTQVSASAGSNDGGTLIFDSVKFKTKLAESPDDVVGLFASQGRTSDNQVKFLSNTGATQKGTYAINITTAATQGNLNGTVALGGSTTIDGNNDTLKVNIDGTETAELTLAPGSYSPTQLAAEIQSKINADNNLINAGKTVSVTVDGSNQLVITSNTFGTTSTVEITQVDTNTAAQLGLSVGTGTAGVNVAGTINGKTATGSGKVLTAAVGDDAEGIRLEVSGTTTGDRGTVTFISGVADQLIDKVTSFLASDGAVTTKTNSLTESLDDIADERVKLDERVEAFRKQLETQFTAADIQIAKLKNTQDFIKSQLDALVASSKSD
ncbi:flagellar filament capping protein FliD [Spartinivicinus poritis]|uniref:Flagellar hook-associated protein 2 n=1 Tax=Spartinivicinus poritis TaxID=2994640 RepID=A0ABT5UB39_9GAMM|nr:flagellar filament capping protein FliD [Spartinivicinus sp. A2-2]MDE1463532.1 flagellar filament capping protein FliD [Spartinivicinus sp. A2-2]